MRTSSLAVPTAFLDRLALIALAVLPTIAALAPLGCARAPVPPDVVLVLADTLRADHMSLYGYERPTTPELERWAQQAAVFTTARSQAACTFPSVNSLLTSRLPARFFSDGPRRLGIPAQFRSLPEVLGEAGYRTLAVSASPIVRRSPSHFNPIGGFDRGFDRFDERCLNEPARCVADAALELVGDAPEPFFLYAHFMDPHQPYAPPPTYQRRFALRPTRIDHIDEGKIRRLVLRRRADPAAKVAPRVLRHLVDLYDDEIAYLDGELVRLLQMLDERSRARGRELVVVVTADHGEEFLEHGELSHCRNVFETSTRVPLLMRLPGQSAGRHDEPVEVLDVMPTLLDHLGLLASATQVEGRSLLPLLDGGEPPHRHVTSVQNEQRAIADRSHKLIWDLERSTARLFELASDPGETRDVLDQQPRVGRELLRTLQRSVAATEGETRGAAARSREAEARLRALGYL